MTSLSFCETVTATSLSPWHVRARPDGEPLKPGGGLHVQALCGRDLHGGWDITPTEVTPETIARLSAPDHDGRVGVCARCVAALPTG